MVGAVERIGPGVGRHHDVLQAEPEPAGHVDAGLDRERVAGLERRAVARDDVGVFVLLDADAVAGAVDELLAPAGRR